MTTQQNQNTETVAQMSGAKTETTAPVQQQQAQATEPTRRGNFGVDHMIAMASERNRYGHC